MKEKRVKNHFSSYVRRLWRNTHSSLHVNRLYDTALYLKYFTMYEEVSNYNGAGFDDEEFLNFFIREALHKKASEKELEDFITLQINIRQLDFIMERNLDKDTVLKDAKKELAYFEFKINLKKELPIAHEIYVTTMTTLIQKCEKLTEYHNEKIFSKVKKQQLLDNTFFYTIQKLQEFKLDKTELNLGTTTTEEKEKLLQKIINDNIQMLNQFADVLAGTFTEEYDKRLAVMNRHGTYLNFLLFEFSIQKYITLSIEDNRQYNTPILYDFHLSLYEAYSNNIIVMYLHKIADKRTLKKYFEDNNSIDRIKHHKQFILSLINVQKNFKHLPLVLLGLDLGLDTNTIIKLVETIDGYKNKNIKDRYLQLMKDLEHYQLIEENFVNFRMEEFEDIYKKI